MVDKGELLQTKFLLVGSFFIAFLFILIVTFYSFSLTGFTLHDLNTSQPRLGERFQGTIVYDLPETILDSTLVRLELSGFSRELPLRSVMVDSSPLGPAVPIEQHPILEVSALYYPDATGAGFGNHLEAQGNQGVISAASTNGSFFVDTDKILKFDKTGKLGVSAKTLSKNSAYLFENSKNFPGYTSSVNDDSKILPVSTLGSFSDSESTISGKIVGGSEPGPRWVIMQIDALHPALIRASPGSGLAVAYVTIQGRPVSSELVSISFNDSDFIISTDYSTEVIGYVPTPPHYPARLDLGRFNFPIPSVSGLTLKLSIIENSQVISEVTSTLSTNRSNQNITTSRDEGFSSGLGDLQGDHSGTQIEGESASNGEDFSCTYTCTPYGACSIPSIGDLPESGSFQGFVRTRLCYCDDSPADIFIQTQSCETGGTSSSSGSSSGPRKRYEYSSLVEASFNLYHDRPTLSPQNAPSTDTRSSNRPRGAPSVADWSSTIIQTSRDIAIQGALKSELGPNSRVQVSYDGAKHSIGVRTISKDELGRRYVDIEVSSNPQEARLYEGQQSPFDLTGNGILDVVVTFTGYSNNKASIVVEPLKSGGPLQLSPGEKGLQLSDDELKLPVAYVILNEKFPPRLNIILVQSDLRLPAYCSNLIQDSDEEGVDCGPSCRTCYKDHPFYARLISMGLVLFLGLLCLVSFRKRSFLMNY